MVEPPGIGLTTATIHRTFAVVPFTIDFAVMINVGRRYISILYVCTSLCDLRRKWPSSFWKRNAVILKSCHAESASPSWRHCVKVPSSSPGSVTLDCSPLTIHWRNQSRHQPPPATHHTSCSSVTAVWAYIILCMYCTQTHSRE